MLAEGLPMTVRYWLARPHLIWARLLYWVWESINPTKPWLCPGTVAYCEAILSKSMRVLEFGSGRSTTWFARKVGQLTSVEHSEAWFRRVRTEIVRSGVDNIDYRLVPLDHPEQEPEREQYHPLPSYVAQLRGFPDESFDLHRRRRPLSHDLHPVLPIEIESGRLALG